MDAITLLKSDHQAVKRLFRTFEQAGERASSTKSKTAQAIVRALSQHAAIEEQVFYPAVRLEVPDASDEVLEALEEHHVAKWLCAEIERLGPDDERFAPKVTVLIESVRHHIGEEEETLFPTVRHALGRKRLAELGEKMEKLKSRAPTHPHPRSPDTPPGNVAVGAVAGVVDRARDAGEKAVAQSRKKAGSERGAGSEQPRPSRSVPVSWVRTISMHRADERLNSSSMPS